MFLIINQILRWGISMDATLIGIILMFVGIVACASLSRESEEERLSREHGPINSELVCTHCQSKGTVRTKKTEQTKGIHGGKAAGAVMTGGLSILATGISRHEKTTKCRCDHCKMEWFI